MNSHECTNNKPIRAFVAKYNNTLEIDPKQLEYMKVSATPGILEFEIKALADGDYLQGLDFVLRGRE